MSSIDIYLLSELGVFLPELERFQTKFFITSFSDLTGGRFDPKLYDQSTKALKNAISSALYDKTLLKSLITHSASGEWGKDENEVLTKEYKKCLVVRATEFVNDGNLNLNSTRVKYRLIHEDKLKWMDIKANDLLIEKSGGSPDQPVGRIAIITNEMLSEQMLCYSNFIHKIRVDTQKVNPSYLFYLLKTLHNIKLTDAMQSQTNGIRNLIMSNYLNQEIILPPMIKQNEIVDRINGLRLQIDTLQNDANSILDNARAKVEKMILG